MGGRDCHRRPGGPGQGPPVAAARDAGRRPAPPSILATTTDEGRQPRRMASGERRTSVAFGARVGRGLREVARNATGTRPGILRVAGGGHVPRTASLRKWTCLVDGGNVPMSTRWHVEDGREWPQKELLWKASSSPEEKVWYTVRQLLPSSRCLRLRPKERDSFMTVKPDAANIPRGPVLEAPPCLKISAIDFGYRRTMCEAQQCTH